MNFYEIKNKIENNKYLKNKMYNNIIIYNNIMNNDNIPISAKKEIKSFLTEHALSFFENREIPNDYIKHFEKEELTYVRDDRSPAEMALTFILNEIDELSTMSYLKLCGYNISLNPTALHNTKETKINSNPDFIVFENGGKITYIEQETYNSERKRIKIKKTKHDTLVKLIKKGYQVKLINKCVYIKREWIDNKPIIKDIKISYNILDYREVYKKDLYTIHTEKEAIKGHFGKKGKPFVSINKDLEYNNIKDLPYIF